MDRWKAEVVRVKEEKRREETRREEKSRAEERREEKRREEERRSKKRKSQKRESLRRKKIQKKEDPGARKGSKVAKHCVFPMICGSGGSKSSFFTCKCASCHNGVPFFISHLASWLCTRRFSEPRSEHFLKLRCRKSARRCGAKHISMSKCAKHTRSGPLLEVEMSKKCTPAWREAHFDVKMYKTHQVRTTFGS